MTSIMQRNFENDPIINNSGKVTINHPSTFKTENPSMVYGTSFNPPQSEDTNWGQSALKSSGQLLMGVSPNPSNNYSVTLVNAVPTSYGTVLQDHIIDIN